MWSNRVLLFSVVVLLKRSECRSSLGFWKDLKNRIFHSNGTTVTQKPTTEQYQIVEEATSLPENVTDKDLFNYTGSLNNSLPVFSNFEPNGETDNVTDSRDVGNSTLLTVPTHTETTDVLEENTFGTNITQYDEDVRNMAILNQTETQNNEIEFDYPQQTLNESNENNYPSTTETIQRSEENKSNEEKRSKRNIENQTDNNLNVKTLYSSTKNGTIPSTTVFAKHVPEPIVTRNQMSTLEQKELNTEINTENNNNGILISHTNESLVNEGIRETQNITTNSSLYLTSDGNSTADVITLSNNIPVSSNGTSNSMTETKLSKYEIKVKNKNNSENFMNFTDEIIINESKGDADIKNGNKNCSSCQLVPHTINETEVGKSSENKSTEIENIPIMENLTGFNITTNYISSRQNKENDDTNVLNLLDGKVNNGTVFNNSSESNTSTNSIIPEYPSNFTTNNQENLEAELTNHTTETSTKLSKLKDIINDSTHTIGQFVENITKEFSNLGSEIISNVFNDNDNEQKTKTFIDENKNISIEITSDANKTAELISQYNSENTSTNIHTNNETNNSIENYNISETNINESSTSIAKDDIDSKTSSTVVYTTEGNSLLYTDTPPQNDKENQTEHNEEVNSTAGTKSGRVRRSITLTIGVDVESDSTESEIVTVQPTIEEELYLTTTDGDFINETIATVNSTEAVCYSQHQKCNDSTECCENFVCIKPEEPNITSYCDFIPSNPVLPIAIP